MYTHSAQSSTCTSLSGTLTLFASTTSALKLRSAIGPGGITIGVCCGCVKMVSPFDSGMAWLRNSWLCSPVAASKR